MHPKDHPPGPGILARQAARESSARTYARTMPIVPVRASGMTIEGADGRTYLDCLSGAGVLALGHNHPAVIEAITAAMGRGIPFQTLDVATPEKDAFTDAIFASLPRELAEHGRIHFCGPTGADAIEAALKLTQWATGRNGLATFTGGFHGMTSGALAITGNLGARGRLAGLATDVTRLPYPYAYRCPFGVGGERTAELSATYIERLLDDVNGGVPTPAAMVLEAVQGEGGVVPAPDGWLREVRRITAERGIPMVVDEVQSGVGRTGTFWAIDHAGVVPDVLVMSKAIGGGLPLAAIVYREELDGWAAGAHTGTFRGDQLAMVAGEATLRVIEADGLVARAAALGHRALAGLRELQARHDTVGDVRGRGLMLGVELVQADQAPDRCGARPADPALAVAMRRACLERGLIVELGGRDDTVLRLLPPLVTTDEQLDAVLDRLDDAFGSLRAPRAGGAAAVATVELSGGRGGAESLRPLVATALDALALGAADRGGPLPTGGPDAVVAAMRDALDGEVLPRQGVGSTAALATLTRALAAGAADPADPACAAHLHCPPLAVAVAADLVVSALNPSLDSWDQAPSAVALEAEVVGALARLVGWGSEAGGTITTGGTESNLMGILLGREHVGRSRGLEPVEDGVTPGIVRVLGSRSAHFSLERSAALLGLGERHVLGIDVDAGHRMRPEALEEALAALPEPGTAVVVATAGTTDAGAVDPLVALAEVARRHGAWFHVDAAYGGMALCSDALGGLLDGIALADSVALDLHKFGWQPVAAGALVVRDAELLAPLTRRVAYLNPADDEAAGFTSLLGASLRTTRRSDAFKVAVTMRALGRQGLGALVDRCHALARHAASAIAAHERLELELDPVLSTVLFRYTGAPDHLLDEVNGELRRALLSAGTAVIGRTDVVERGVPSTRLKLTLLNPTAREADVDALLAAVVAAGDAEARIRKQG